MLSFGELKLSTLFKTHDPGEPSSGFLNLLKLYLKSWALTYLVESIPKIFDLWKKIFFLIIKSYFFPSFEIIQLLAMSGLMFRESSNWTNPLNSWFTGQILRNVLENAGSNELMLECSLYLKILF